MAAGTRIQLKRKAGAFADGELAAGECGVDTTNGKVYFSKDGITVTCLGADACTNPLTADVDTDGYKLLNVDHTKVIYIAGSSRAVFTRNTDFNGWWSNAGGGVVNTLEYDSANNRWNYFYGGAGSRLYGPAGLVLVGNTLYISDSGIHNIRKITNPMTLCAVESFVGSPTGQYGSQDGTGTGARFQCPSGIAANANGDIYVADTNNHTIRKITSAGVVTTIAGTAGSYGTADGTGSQARFNYPVGIAVTPGDDVYVADGINHTIRKITSAGVVTTIAGTAGSYGTADGAGGAARFNNPKHIVYNSTDNCLYVADYNNHAIRKVTLAGVVTTLAGTCGTTGSTDGTGSSAGFNHPWGITAAPNGDLYVADHGNYTIRKVTLAGVVTTIVGRAGYQGAVDGQGSAARFISTTCLAINSSGCLFAGDNLSAVLRKIIGTSAITIAGSPYSLTYNNGWRSVVAYNISSSVFGTYNNGASVVPGISSININHLLYPTTDGAAGDMMVTNGSSVLSWATPNPAYAAPNVCFVDTHGGVAGQNGTALRPYGDLQSAISTGIPVIKLGSASYNGVVYTYAAESKNLRLIGNGLDATHISSLLVIAYASGARITLDLSNSVHITDLIVYTSQASIATPSITIRNGHIDTIQITGADGMPGTNAYATNAPGGFGEAGGDVGPVLIENVKVNHIYIMAGSGGAGGFAGPGNGLGGATGGNGGNGGAITDVVLRNVDMLNTNASLIEIYSGEGGMGGTGGDDGLGGAGGNGGAGGACGAWAGTIEIHQSTFIRRDPLGLLYLELVVDSGGVGSGGAGGSGTYSGNAGTAGTIQGWPVTWIYHSVLNNVTSRSGNGNAQVSFILCWMACSPSVDVPNYTSSNNVGTFYYY
jgi:hypothetical protein